MQINSLQYFDKYVLGSSLEFYENSEHEPLWRYSVFFIKVEYEVAVPKLKEALDAQRFGSSSLCKG